MVDLLNNSFPFKKETYSIIGAAMEVHNQLGHGFLEEIYQEALEIELTESEIDFDREVPLTIKYKKTPLQKKYFADFICFGEIVIELKALSDLCSDHESQVLNYLKATNTRLGLLINFGKSRLQYKRIINEHYF